MHRAYEKGSILTVDLSWPDARRVVQTTRFEAYCDNDETGTRRSISGPPPRSWTAVEAASPAATEPVAASTALADFASAIGLPLSIRYSKLTSRRYMLTAIDQWCSRPVDVFALTGRIRLTNGRFMSLGWSGVGDGLARLEHHPARERLRWIAAMAGHAGPTATGTVPVVLAAQPAAVIAHEAIGHFAEASADPSLDLRHRLGCRLGCDGFDAIDDPTCGAAARYELDDEGTAAIGPTMILRDGVLVRQLHGARSAQIAGDLSTANARSSQITMEPIPRMSNLVIPGGTASFEELVEAMGDGAIVHHLSHGFSRGIDIEARITLGERVARGRATGAFFSGGRITERVDVLTACVGRSRRSELNPNALCGKYGQILYDVGTLAPAMRLSGLRMAA